MVVDSIVDLEDKISKMRDHFGSDIRFVVENKLVSIFKTYSYNIDAIYTQNCSTVLQGLLLRLNTDDTIIYFTSLDVDMALLRQFTNSIGDRSKVVVLEPRYNIFERIFNKMYNTYVKNLFTLRDSLCCKKLQFIPKDLLEELLATHLGNRLFDIPDRSTIGVVTKDNKVNASWKNETRDHKPLLINLIIALSITLLLVISLTVFHIKYILISIFIMCYLLDFVISLIYAFKTKFDNRFLK